MITVGNPEKQQTPMESYITYEIRTETDRVEYSIQQGGVLSFLIQSKLQLRDRPIFVF